MNGQLFKSLHLQGFLSFGPESLPVELRSLNVLLGPNGVGKSNFIEAIELLRAAPVGFGHAIRLSGTPSDWIWRGGKECPSAKITAELSLGKTDYRRSEESADALWRYHLEFMERDRELEILEESLEASNDGNTSSSRRHFARESLDPQHSILFERKGSDVYPEITAVAKAFEHIHTFREWGFGRSASLRMPQSVHVRNDVLVPQLMNLGMVINDLEKRGHLEHFNELMKQFLPRFTRISTQVQEDSVQIYLHEEGLRSGVPATRLSDGTLRFLSMLALLVNAGTVPLICIEEPELGLHPDAMAILAEVLVEASAQTQVIVTTHSDHLVSALTEYAESVLVCDYLQNGTELRRLDSSKLESWLKDYRLGDIWRSGKVGGNLW